MPTPAASTVPPELRAIVICVEVTQDDAGRPCLLSLFDSLCPQSVPVKVGPIALYTVLTGCHSDVAASARLTDTDGEITLAEALNIEARISSPREVVSVTFEFPMVEFPHYGEYTFRLEVNGHVLGERRFDVVHPEH